MIVCKKQTTDLQQGIQNLIDTMVEDYAKWAKSMDWDDSTTVKFADKIRTTEGKKYIKIVENGGGVKAFVVGVDNDKKFKKGDILLPAGFNAPARNFARGNILDGGYGIAWTGPLYGK